MNKDRKVSLDTAEDNEHPLLVAKRDPNPED